MTDGAVPVFLTAPALSDDERFTCSEYLIRDDSCLQRSFIHCTFLPDTVANFRNIAPF